MKRTHKLPAKIFDIIQVKWKPTGETLKPKFDKFNPINGIKRIFNVKTIVELIKQIVVLAVCVIVTYNKLKSKIGMLFNLYDITLQQAVVAMGDLIIDLGITISVIRNIVVNKSIVGNACISSASFA